MKEGMRKKRPFLLFWLAGFFVFLLLSAAITGKTNADIKQTTPETTIASKKSLDQFKGEFSTYWWEDYTFKENYDKGELEIYLPKGKEKNQFTNINDVLSAISLRQYQFKDKSLLVLLHASDGEKLARMKNGKVIKSYSDKVDEETVANRLKEWKKANTQQPIQTTNTAEESTTETTTQESAQ
ncbi:hypothetical protein D920_00462 [Enterococcus faecalis 13-SD-W-01]|nr:hypothetical protein D920_00462 [Enterococcus faecalis 13-SD-W-01]